MVVQQGTERLVAVSDGTRVWVSLPDRLLDRLDAMAQGAGMSRDDALRRAVEAFVGRTRGGELGSAMVQGYQAMAQLNLALAAEDEETLADWPMYERSLAEADSSGDL